jgi:hypothetical protein
MKILIPLISLVLFSCNNASKEKSKVYNETITHKEHQHNSDVIGIELNNGEKWKVDEAMLLHIRSMESDVFSFSKLKEKEYKTLAISLQSKINLLTSNCTMKGKAHDELHKWLLPYIDLVKEFSESKDETTLNEQFQKIQTSFTTFNQYFK